MASSNNPYLYYHSDSVNSIKSNDHNEYGRCNQPFVVKSEQAASPVLPPSPRPHFTFSGYQQHHSSQQHQPLYRLGGSQSHHSHSNSHSNSPTPFTFMSSHPWPGPSYSSGLHHDYLPGLHDPRGLSFHDEYEDADELADLPDPVVVIGSSGSGRKDEKQIRRRSSKACDQCRKSKCKCERSTENEPCKNCVLLGTPCTFLGPSRKRGPPKGYIDAIEARLHQTEALIGILLGSNDARAISLFEDLGQVADPLTKEIINRVDNSPYGTKGRRRGADMVANGNRPRHVKTTEPAPAPLTAEQQQAELNLRATHPSNEWQDEVISKLRSLTQGRGRNGMSHGHSSSFDETSLRYQPRDEWPGSSDKNRPSLSVLPPSSDMLSSADRQEPSPIRRQRRRLDEPESYDNRNSPSPSRISDPHSPAARRGSFHQSQQASLMHGHRASIASITNDRGSAYSGSQPSQNSHSDFGSPSPMEESGDDDELADAVGQLSLNEHEEVRYHSKVSGLHLLGVKERVDGRSEGGVWKFPSSRVWPPLPPHVHAVRQDDEYSAILPSREEQERLLGLYFTYVHSAFPILHKKGFLEDFRNPGVDSAQASPDSNSPARSSGLRRRRHRIPPLLLLAMFSIAARYDTKDEQPSSQGSMWPAGDPYLEEASKILDSTYSSSRPTTCQALLLMGYREIGIGAMAQAWLYIGMAVRMAQDLGMHKSADRWQRSVPDLFTLSEMQERKRIWYGCVIMDKYVSTYIGRPLAIFESDFDCGFPSEDEAEEFEEWQPHPSDPFLIDRAQPSPPVPPPAPGRIISCFNACARLSIILSKIVQAIYPIHPVPHIYEAALRIEKELDKWYLDLPEHLRYDPAFPKNPSPSPHVMTLHLHYWCTVLLLHRPFIRPHSTRNKSPASDSQGDDEIHVSQKNYDLCVRAANHITSIVSVYLQNFCIRRSSVFLCYYIFTATIMHVTTLTTYPNDPQARVGLKKLMDALEKMEITWPAAGRARELIHGSKVWILDSSNPRPENTLFRPKRALESEEVDQHIPAAESAVRHQTYSPPIGQGYPPVVGEYPASDPSNLPYFPPFDRWNGDSNLAFPGSLSTSVLPQQYSTGFVDDRSPAAARRGHPHVDGSGNTRYPQLWNDYSTLGQLGSTAYGLPGLHDLSVPQNGHGSSAPQSHQQQPSSMYMHEQYNLFNN